MASFQGTKFSKSNSRFVATLFLLDIRQSCQLVTPILCIVKSKRWQYLHSFIVWGFRLLLAVLFRDILSLLLLTYIELVDCLPEHRFLDIGFLCYLPNRLYGSFKVYSLKVSIQDVLKKSIQQNKTKQTVCYVKIAVYCSYAFYVACNNI